MSTLGPKAVVCLAIAALPKRDHDEWRRAYDAACERYSEKAVLRMFDSLAARDYIEYGVSARTGWLTEKGRAAMNAQRSDL
jgi:hypothetical protein